MAYRRSKGKSTKRKIEPAVSTFAFAVPTGASYIDLSLCAAIMNRRAYSQGLTWAVAGFTSFSPPETVGGLAISKLPETWVMSNAWHKSKILWNKMNRQVLDDEPSIRGKYADFKISMDSNMGIQTIQTASNLLGNILTPIDRIGNYTTADFTAGVSPRADWDYSTIEIPNDPTSGITAEYALHAVGPDTPTSMGVIHGYALSRSRPNTNEPNTPTLGGWMTELFDVGEQMDELRADIIDDNDRPPYAVKGESSSIEAYPGGATEFPDLQIHASTLISGTTVGGKTSAPGGIFQCGLIRFDNSTPSPLTIILNLVPGYSRGYTTGKMEDV